MKSPETSPLAELAEASGVVVPCDASRPVDLGDPDCFWFVETGAVDIFIVERRDGVVLSAPQHLLRAGGGRLVPCVFPHDEDSTLGLVAKGLPGTVLLRIEVSKLAKMPSVELAAQVDTWLLEVSAALSRDVPHRSRPGELIESGLEPVSISGTVSARGGVAWVTDLPAGTGLFLDLVDPSELEESRQNGTPAAIALTPASWLTVTETVLVRGRSSEMLAEESRLLACLAGFHELALSVERLNRSLAVVDQMNLDRAWVTSRLTSERRARQRLVDLYDPTARGAAPYGGDHGFEAALRIVGRHEQIEFKIPRATDNPDSTPPLRDVLDASGVRARRVRLVAEDRWWAADSGAMLAFRADDGRPVALLPGTFGSYKAVDPVERTSVRVTAKSAREYRDQAWSFYAPLPACGTGVRELFRIARKGLAGGVARFLAAGMLAGPVMLLPALMLGFVLSEVVPASDGDTVRVLTAVLAACAVIWALLQVLQGMALLQIEGRAVSRMEAAFWDRLLRLPPAVLHRYPSGELGMRAMSLQQLRDAALGVLANSVLSTVLLLPAVLLLFLYDTVLGSVATAFSLLSLCVVLLLGLRQVAPHRRMVRATHRVVGRLLEIITGIGMFRVDGAEGLAFATWAEGYREQKLAQLQLGAFEQHLRAFGAALPLIAGAVLVMAAWLSRPDGISAADFLVAYALFMVFQSAVVRLSASFGAVAAVLPAIQHIRPFLAEPTERSHQGETVTSLRGELSFDHVSFRYDPDGPLILDDVCIHALPGEFIAITGESGAGKSTLFSLAVGNERPTGGAVYYDGRDLRHLNLKQVRRRLGVVPQEVNLNPQDLWDNIAGDDDGITGQDTRRAARTAAVESAIADMPMGLLTPVGSSLAATSGGENQRIMIARAVAGNPAILLLDEATNSLDNETQTKVIDNLAHLPSTRIVIAHRLSTLKSTDRIYVLQGGKVVQQGSFSELEATPGLFRDLMRRQKA